MNRILTYICLTACCAASLLFVDVDRCSAQVYEYEVPSVYTPYPYGRSHHRHRSATMVPIQMAHPAYFAPQVLVVPMAGGPVPTMSAYYVPTVPVVGTYYAPAVSHRHRWHHRHHIKRHSIPVVPAVIHPIYWNYP